MHVYRAIFHDPKTYPDPNKFNPDRWVISGPTGIPEKLNPHLREPTAHFGFGRRLAFFTLRINTLRTRWLFRQIMCRQTPGFIFNMAHNRFGLVHL